MAGTRLTPDGPRALTLWQPYASLIAEGAKTIETRSWSDLSMVGGTLAVHAGRKPLDEERRTLARRWGLDPDGLPFGVVVALADVVRMCRVTGEWPDGIGIPRIWGWDPVSGETVPVPADELGDFSKGRWTWWLDNARKLERPVRCRGRMGVWRMDAETERAVVREAG